MPNKKGYNSIIQVEYMFCKHKVLVQVRLLLYFIFKQIRWNKYEFFNPKINNIKIKNKINTKKRSKIKSSIKNSFLFPLNTV